jgi:hypothetical protein
MGGAWASAPYVFVEDEAGDNFFVNLDSLAIDLMQRVGLTLSEL